MEKTCWRTFAQEVCTGKTGAGLSSNSGTAVVPFFSAGEHPQSQCRPPCGIPGGLVLEISAHQVDHSNWMPQRATAPNWLGSIILYQNRSCGVYEVKTGDYWR